MKNLIKDDEGQYWVWGAGKLRCVGDDSPESGYDCGSFAESLSILVELGYITYAEEESQRKIVMPLPADDYFDDEFGDDYTATDDSED